MEKKEKKPKSRARKIVEWILLGVFGLFFGVVLAGNISSMIHKKENYGQPIRFGVGTFQIRTSSMEPDIGQGTIVVSYKEDTKKFEERLKNKETIDVVFANINVEADFTPYNPIYTPDKRVVTNEVMVHRLMEVHVNEDVEFGKGRYIFVAAGINDEGEYSKKAQHQVFTEVQYLGSVKITSKFLGGFTKVMSSPIGLIILLLIPAGYLIASSSIDIYRALKAEEEAQGEAVVPTGSERIDKLSEKDRERIKNELLEEMLSKKKEGK